MKNYWQNKYDIDNLFNAPQFKKIKYAALIVIGIIIAIQIATIVWIDSIPYKTMIFLRGSYHICNHSDHIGLQSTL